MSAAPTSPAAVDADRVPEVLDAVPEALLIVDDRRRVVQANRAAAALFGSNALGADLALLISDQALLAGVEEALAHGRRCDVETVLPERVERHFAVTITPLGGHGAVVALHDLTEVKRATRLRADFVANASHEIRSPLASIVGLLETVRGIARDDEEARERFLGIMAEEAARMAQLVDDLLSLSKIEMREHAPPTAPVSLAAIVHEVVDALALRAKARPMTVEVVTARSLPAVIGDRDELALMVRNLVANAIAYGRTGSVVTVTLAHADNDVVLAVRDQGEGIAAKHIPRLTERFYRVDKGRSRTMGGTGLGLAIVKHVVNRHRGHLEIESTRGVGSVFTVRLPAAADGHRPVTEPS